MATNYAAMKDLVLSTNYSALPKNLPNRNNSNWTIVTSSNPNSSVNQISGTEITFEKLIGSGYFGEVWKGKWY